MINGIQHSKAQHSMFVGGKMLSPVGKRSVTGLTATGFESHPRTERCSRHGAAV